MIVYYLFVANVFTPNINIVPIVKYNPILLIDHRHLL